MSYLNVVKLKCQVVSNAMGLVATSAERTNGTGIKSIQFYGTALEFIY